MTPIHRLLRRALATLFPYPCFGCGAPIPWGPAPLGLCPACRRALRPVASYPCSGCARPMPAGPTQRCGACLRRPPAWDELLCRFSYEDPLPAIVRGIKFQRLDFLAEDLGREMACAFRHEIVARCDLVVAVPLAWPRRLARGFNQAEVLSRALANELGLPLARALRRRSRRRQARLGRRQRVTNLRGTFRCGTSVSGRRLLLVDDVVTTGATLEAATRALRAAGAQSVVAAVAARTPRLHEPQRPGHHPRGSESSQPFDTLL